MCLNIHTQPLQLGVNVVNPTCVRCPQRMRRALNHFVFSLQVLTILQEVFPAVKAAEMAVKFRPLWWEGWQTLGRAQLNLGEVDLVSRGADALRRKKTKRSQVAERPLQQMRALVCSGGAGVGGRCTTMPSQSFGLFRVAHLHPKGPPFHQVMFWERLFLQPTINQRGCRLFLFTRAAAATCPRTRRDTLYAKPARSQSQSPPTQGRANTQFACH